MYMFFSHCHINIKRPEFTGEGGGPQFNSINLAFPIGRLEQYNCGVTLCPDLTIPGSPLEPED